MPQALTPTKQILKAAQQINCQISLNSVAKCQYKTCQQFSANIGDQHLEKLDKYWCEFLKAQQQSTANYLYKISLFGDAKDPTLVKKEPVPADSINRRLLHMPYVGGLSKGDMFYLLSLLLNLMKLPGPQQKEYMEHFQNQRLIDVEIIQYLQMISRHPNAGLSNTQLKEFQEILQYLRERDNSAEFKNYYNAEHIFLKSVNKINPYELEYLRSILQTGGKLSSQQFMYLASFVDKLQEICLTEREQYLEFLYDHQILPFKRFETLIMFMRSKAKRFNQTKLKLLHKELERLMNLGPCVPESEPPIKEIENKPSVIHVDFIKIDKALYYLMKSAIPNIVRVTDLKNFLKDMLFLDPEQIEANFCRLKSVKVLTLKRLKYIENFINSGKLGKVDKAKKKELLQIIKKVVGTPVSTGVMANLSIPASKGPPVEKVENKAKAEEIPKQTTEPEKKPEETKKLVTNETNKKSPKEPAKKSSKKANKKPKKKAGKKKKK